MEFTGERFIPDAQLEKEIEVEHFLRYQAVSALVNEKIVLDAASGEGYGSNLLAGHARQVHGLEIDHAAVSQARTKYRKSNLNFIQGSIERLPFPDSTFDVVVSFETIEHVEHGLQEAFLAEIKRVLRPEGVLVISTPDKRLYSDLPKYHNQYHIKEFYREEFDDFLHRYFKEVRFWEQTAILTYLIANGREEVFRQCMPKGTLQGKYIVALCSDIVAPDAITSSITLDREDLYQKKIDRVLALQDEVDEKNRHLFRCEDVLAETDRNVKAHEKNAIALQGQIVLLQKQMEESQRQRSNERETLEASIQALSEELRRIKSTRGWKLIQTIYHIKNKLR